MTPTAILEQARSNGVTLAAEGGALRYQGPRKAIEELLPTLKNHKAELLVALAQPPNLSAILAEACQGVEGIDRATFRALLSPEDIEDIEGGHIPVHTLNAYAQSFAEGIRTGRIRVLVPGRHGRRLAPAIPRPAVTERVRCADCRYFERDTIGDGSGIGRCKIGGEGTGPRYPALWANAERDCQDFTTLGVP